METQKKQVRFTFPDKDKGILVCDIVVEAEDDWHACDTLNRYLSHLKWVFYKPPAQLGASTDSKQIATELMGRLRALTDPAAFVITLHLFTEHWLNAIVRKFCPLIDITHYSYFRKLEIAFAMGKLTEDIFHNLKQLNSLRNKIAHNLDFDLTAMDLNYRGCMPGWELSGYKPSYDFKAQQHHISNVLVGVMAVTYSMLHNHCVKEIGLTSSSTAGETPASAAKTN